MILDQEHKLKSFNAKNHKSNIEGNVLLVTSKETKTNKAYDINLLVKTITQAMRRLSDNNDNR